VSLDTEHGPFGPNAALAAGLASLDGYSFPQRRFVALVRALRSEPYSQNALLLRFHEEFLPSRVLFQLYNVGFALQGRAGSGAPEVLARGPTAGAAWFPTTLETDEGWNGLAGTLLAWGDEAHAQARRELRVLDEDLAATGLDGSLPPECAHCQVGKIVSATGGGESARILLRGEVGAPARCPLVLALNYGTVLEAWGRRDDGSRARLRTFPAYGALLGVLVEPGVTRVEVGTRPWPPRWTLGAAAMGALLALAVVFRSGR
jgi:hypothetical protein